MSNSIKLIWNPYQQQVVKTLTLILKIKRRYLKSNNNSFKLRRLTSKEKLNLSMKLFDEAKYLSEKKEKERRNFLRKYPFKPSINNKESPKASNFYIRLNDWLEQKSQNSTR